MERARALEERIADVAADGDEDAEPHAPVRSAATERARAREQRAARRRRAPRTTATSREARAAVADAWARVHDERAAGRGAPR